MIKQYRKYLGILTISFQIGVDVLGFPQFHKHQLARYTIEHSKNYSV